MPKIVDHEKQRHVVAEATLRVIRRSGLEHATVRNIAMEAGLSVGSMRHYFSTQVELFAFCMNLFLHRIEKRVETMIANGPVLLDLRRLLMQFLPVDEDRKMEMEVWLSFNAKALIHPELKALSDEMQESLYKVARFVLDTLLEHNLAKPGLDADMETEKLYALIDGLAVHQIMRPRPLTTGELEAIIEHHLNLLSGGEEN